MEHQNLLNLLNERSHSKLATRKQNIFNDQSNANIHVENEIIYNTVLKSNLVFTNNAHKLGRSNITIIGHIIATQVASKNFAPFTKCITKIEETSIDEAKDLGLVMAIQNLIEYSSNYSETTRSLGFYSKDERTDFNNDLSNTDDFKSFMYQANLKENTEADGANGILKNVIIDVPIKYIINFWRSLEIPLIDCKVELKLKWTKYCVLSAAGADYASYKSNQYYFHHQKHKIICFCSDFISNKESQTIKNSNERISKSSLLE